MEGGSVMARQRGWQRWCWLAAAALALLLGEWLWHRVISKGPRPLRGADGASEEEALRRYKRNEVPLHLIPRIWDRRQSR
jgi:hypothetical protein